ncbi:hypothetical protein [Stenotrophomonas sp. PS02289]|uniref:hypothetical protein n=1 Tax=Stenotrophomonas sp. PS02289 TaxID=2991422 RepID=UPI00249A07D6|nr:hypothetical protein [Stenotrophomonas sp. PS02289]
MRIASVMLLLLAPITSHAQTGLPTTPQQVPRYCQQREAQPVSLLVLARDEVKTPRNQFIEAANKAAIGAAGIQMLVERVNDVYDNPELTRDTLWVFRSARCIEEFSHRGFVSYAPAINAALLTCQQEHAGTLRAVAECVATASDTHLIR